VTLELSEKEELMSRHVVHEDLVSQAVTGIMSSPAVAIVGSARLGSALTALTRTGLRHLVVVDEHRRCVGVVADRAIAAAWAADPAALECVPVAAVIEPRPAVVGADASVGEVARVMHTDGVDAVAVIDRSGRPIGLVTGGDLIALMAHHIPTDETDEDLSQTVRDFGPYPESEQDQ
jgi:CBS domain-containing protein